MTQITRVFDDQARAQAALDELKARRFNSVELAAAPDAHGKAMIRVEAPFGTAIRVEEILNRHANGTPAPSGSAVKPAVAFASVPPREPPQKTATPRMAPTAAKAEAVKPAAPPRDGAKSGPRTLSQLLGIPELIDSDTFFSGFPLLIRPTPKAAAAKGSAAKPG